MTLPVRIQTEKKDISGRGGSSNASELSPTKRCEFDIGNRGTSFHK